LREWRFGRGRDLARCDVQALGSVLLATVKDVSRVGRGPMRIVAAAIREMASR
jgi:hypothetical protein